MFFFGGALACGGQARITLAQRAGDAGDEHDDQRGVDHEADQQADDVGAGQTVHGVVRDRQVDVVDGEDEKAQRGDHHDRPDVAAAQQHRAHGDLQQVEKDERIAGAAAEIQLHGEHGHVHQQREKQLHVAHAAPGAPAQHGNHVEDAEAGDHHQHFLHRQLQVERVVRHLDGEDLADDGDPAQLDEQVQVLQTGMQRRRAQGPGGDAGLVHDAAAAGVHEAGLSRNQASLAESGACAFLRSWRTTSHAAPSTMRARPYQVRM